ncbi:uroporphyrinogen decarboxylase family protein [Serratia sp. 1D1416]|uniref:uroporphyrinogen decarboxylase family protein n=1 Tax=Serratia sp. 1D1416 TaxID=2447890 RepID=UPI001013C76E|nr:uroporphyrinogen decarboxylase family protein [Serratia sp. 1D1416]
MNRRFQQLFTTVGQSRPLVSVWKHFIKAEQDPQALAAQTIAFQTLYQWDFVKINPRATYYAEAFGNRYDTTDYTGVLPKLDYYPFHQAADLTDWANTIWVDYQPFAEQILVARQVRNKIAPETPIIQTLFSPLCILTFLAGHNPYPGAPAEPAKNASQLRTLLELNPKGVKQALALITDTCIRYVHDTLEQDIDGFFYSIFGHGNPQALPGAYYDEFSAPYDQKIFHAIKQRQGLLMFHTCGADAHPQKFAEIPEIDILHWADHDERNPALSECSWLQGKIAAGGIDQRLFASARQLKTIKKQAQQATLAQTGSSFVLTAGCGLPIATTAAALWALRLATITPAER